MPALSLAQLRRLVRDRPVELVLSAVLALALPGVASLAVAPAPRHAFTHPTSGARVTSSSSFTRDGYDTAYLLDGIRDEPRLAWSSQEDASPWVKLELAKPMRVERVVVHGGAASVALRPPERGEVLCLGAKAPTPSPLSSVPDSRALAAVLDGSPCGAILVRFTDPWLAEVAVTVTELELVEASP